MLRGCKYVSRVERAARSGVWPAELRSHTRTCKVCGDTALVAGALLRERRPSLASGGVADAERIWRIAQLRARCAAAERATQSIAVVETVGLVCGTFVGAMVLVSEWPLFVSWAAELQEIRVILRPGAVGAWLPTVVVGSVILGLLLRSLGFSFDSIET